MAGEGLSRKKPLERGGKPLSRSKGLSPGKGLNPGKGLSRGKPLASNKPLTSTRGLSPTSGPGAKTPMPRGRGLQRSASSKMNQTPLKQTKPPARKVTPRSEEEEACRRIVAQRSGGLCETCGTPGGLEKAHRVARSQGGRWDPENILDLCHSCHAGNHARPTRAYEHGWHLRRHQDPAAEPVLLWKGGLMVKVLLHADGGWASSAAPDEGKGTES